LCIDLQDIFTSKTRKNILPLQQVTNFLSQFGRVMVEAYLEWLVLERKANDDKAESALAWHYLETVLALLQTTSKESVSSGSGAPAASGLLGPARVKLVNLLQSHSNYSPHQILARIQNLPLHNEKIILYQKVRHHDMLIVLKTLAQPSRLCLPHITQIGQHDKALQIIVEDLKDYPKAEQYCLHHGAAASSNTLSGDDDDESISRFNSLLLALLRMYISLESAERYISPWVISFWDHIPDLGFVWYSTPKKAIELLNKFPTLIDPALAIQVLSSNIPLHLLMDYLPIALRNSTHKYREGQVVKNLEKSQNLKVRGRKIQKTSKSIIITRDVICPLCGKPIGDKVRCDNPRELPFLFCQECD
jgi:hypothetical protein